MFTKLFICILLACSCAQAQILNAYAKVSSIAGLNLTVTNVDQTYHTFNVGEKVLIMQMQDNVIGTNTVSTSASFGNIASIGSAGLYEFGIISSRSPATGTPTTITLSSDLVNTYSTGANSALQLVSFRNLGANYTTTANITGLSWNGNTGGVVCFEVGNTLTLQNNISADGIGFLGGARSANYYNACDPGTYAAAIGNRYAGKGEGIYNSANTAYDGARGKIANGGGGGNDVNSGGAGGGNYSVGGIGGIGWIPAGTGCSPTVGGIGGLALNSYISANRVFMGGGGGGGHQNDNVGSAGGNGGGIILIKAMRLVSGSCTDISISADGASAANAANDGAGGGGAAGSIILQIPSYSITGTCPLNIRSVGGNGGSSVTSGTHGGGAGGGQGVIIFSSAQPTVNVMATTSPGTAGTSCSGCTASSNPTNGGGPNNAGIISLTSGPLPVELLSFDGELTNDQIRLFWSTSSELNNLYYAVERSYNALHFSPIGTVTAAGNTRTVSHYQLIDTDPGKGLTYYRLRQVDIDGSYNYSRIIAFSLEKDLDVILYPNPVGVNAPLSLSLNKVNSSTLTVEIYDVAGRLVLSRQLPVEAGQTISLGEAPLAKGVYLVRLLTGNSSATQKLIVH